MGLRDHARIDDRNPPAREGDDPGARHHEQELRRRRPDVARAEDHARADRQARHPIRAVEDHPLGLALGPGVGGVDRVQVPGRVLVGGMLGRAGGERVECGCVDEAFDACRAGFIEQAPRRLDVDRDRVTRRVRPEADPARRVDHGADARARPRGGRPGRGGRRGASRSAGRPARSAAAVRDRPRTACPARARARATCPPTKPPAPVTRTGQSSGRKPLNARRA